MVPGIPFCAFSPSVFVGWLTSMLGAPHFLDAPQADDVVLADTKEQEKAKRTPVGPHHVLRWFGEVATHVKTQVDKVGLANSLAPCGLVSLRMARAFCFPGYSTALDSAVCGW